MWDLIVSVPDHCLSFYFPTSELNEQGNYRTPSTLSKELDRVDFCQQDITKDKQSTPITAGKKNT